ncbi:MAG: hypothetical protein HETSPECPRED_002047 [Heterodermia speciosa]|uniref:Uncharacterized protein n=1 Tax=Heterodermia speciosa TaxID=116794 RepID=A0A8H3IDP4_9LECA|nr:MAG: hypothetical protein HETSPECPRED_002047 [Heterodermia speciosa]
MAKENAEASTDAATGLKSSWAQRIDGMLSASSVATPQGVHQTLFDINGTAIPMLGQLNSDAYHTGGVPGFPGGNEEYEAMEEEMTHRKRQESDFMLAQVYRELARASQDMATWSQATAVALEEKLAAERRESMATEKLLDAQRRYEQATVQITQAYEHRSKR